MSLSEHCSDAFRDGSVSTLCNSILVWLIPNSMLPVDARVLAEFLPFLGHVFPTLVIAQSLQLAVQLVLSIGLELFERSKRSSLVLQWQNGPETRSIINEADPVPVVVSGADWKWAMHI